MEGNAALETLLVFVLREVDEWLNSPQPSGGGHIAVHASLCPSLAERVRNALIEQDPCSGWPNCRCRNGAPREQQPCT